MTPQAGRRGGRRSSGDNWRFSTAVVLPFLVTLVTVLLPRIFPSLDRSYYYLIVAVGLILFCAVYGWWQFPELLRRILLELCCFVSIVVLVFVYTSSPQYLQFVSPVVAPQGWSAELQENDTMIVFRKESGDGLPYCKVRVRDADLDLQKIVVEVQFEGAFGGALKIDLDGVEYMPEDRHQESTNRYYISLSKEPLRLKLARSQSLEGNRELQFTFDRSEMSGELRIRVRKGAGKR